MKKKLLNKTIVIGIIILFIGASILSSTSGKFEKISHENKIAFFRGNYLEIDWLETINNLRTKIANSNQLEIIREFPFDSSNWTSTELVSTESQENSSWCSIASDNSGTIHAVWLDETDYMGSGSDLDIFYKTRSSDGVWTTTEVVSSESSIESDLPAMAVESDGTVHVTWDEFNETTGDLYYKMKPSGGSWTTAECISSELSDYSGISSIAVDPDGTVHVAMMGLTGEDYDIFYKMKPEGGSWTTAELVTYDSTGITFTPAIDVESDGCVHISWAEVDPSYYFSNIYYKMKPAGGSWTDAEAVTQSNTLSYYPSMVVDQTGGIHITWCEFTASYFMYICYKNKPDGGSWSTKDVLSSNGFAISSSIDVESDGTVHVVFDELDSLQGWMWIFYRMKPSGGNWSTTELVTDDFDGDGFFPSIVVDHTDVVHVSWQGMLSVFEEDIYYKNSGYVNQPPEIPTITGKINGKAGKEYEYIFNTIDPNGNDVYYIIDWGDETSEITIGPFPSGENASANYTWSKKDNYMIRAKAKDTFDAESDWGTLNVTMPKIKLFNFNLNLLNWLFDRFPYIFPILRYSLGLS